MMIDFRLNTKYLFGFVGGPRWNTDVKQVQSGKNLRNKVWALPKHEYTADYATLNEAEKEAMLAAFWVAGGSWESFRFRDWNDYKVTAQLISAPPTSTTPLQLTKTYVFGPSEYTRAIKLPLRVKLYFNNGGGPIAFTAFTVDPLTGIAIPTVAWPAGVPSWTGEFDVCVRFSRDFNPFTSPSSDIRECMVELIEEDD